MARLRSALVACGAGALALVLATCEALSPTAKTVRYPA